MSVITLSKFQQAVIDWVTAHIEQAGALIVEAVAGSGKTFTIVKAAQLIPSAHKAVFLAFNKSIATELGQEASRSRRVARHSTPSAGQCVATVSASTSQVDRNKTFDLIDRLLPEESREVRPELLNIIGKAKAHGLSPQGHACTERHVRGH